MSEPNESTQISNKTEALLTFLFVAKSDLIVQAAPSLLADIRIPESERNLKNGIRFLDLVAESVDYVDSYYELSKFRRSDTHPEWVGPMIVTANNKESYHIDSQGQGKGVWITKRDTKILFDTTIPGPRIDFNRDDIKAIFKIMSLVASSRDFLLEQTEEETLKTNLKNAGSLRDDRRKPSELIQVLGSNIGYMVRPTKNEM